MKCPKCSERLGKQIAVSDGNHGAEAGDLIFKGMVLVKGSDGEMQVKCGVCKSMLALGRLVIYASAVPEEEK